jgi:hypothetical protein
MRLNWAILLAGIIMILGIIVFAGVLFKLKGIG